jgi:hypothetical protein
MGRPKIQMCRHGTPRIHRPIGPPSPPKLFWATSRVGRSRLWGTFTPVRQLRLINRKMWCISSAPVAQCARRSAGILPSIRRQYAICPLSQVSDLPAEHHIGRMTKTHPHAEATYRVVAIDDGYFGVEVVIPETNPTMVSRFATEEEAEAWITRHKSRVQSEAGVQSQRWFRRIKPR